MRLLPLFVILICLCGSRLFGAEPTAAELIEEGLKYEKWAIADYANAENPPEVGFSREEYMKDGAVDKARAAECFRKAADLGDAIGQYYYGLVLNSGYGVDKDIVKAAEFFSKSANQGDPAGQFLLGMCFLDGTGRLKDDKEAVKWLKKSSDQGDRNAQEILGLCYAKGQGVDEDFVQAYMWFSLSAAGGNAESVNRRERMAKKMKPEQIEKAQQLSREWKPSTERTNPE